MVIVNGVWGVDYMDLTNPWYLVTLFGAPELWAVLAAFLFGAYLAYQSRNNRANYCHLNYCLIK